MIHCPDETHAHHMGSWAGDTSGNCSHSSRQAEEVSSASASRMITWGEICGVQMVIQVEIYGDERVTGGGFKRDGK